MLGRGFALVALLLVSALVAPPGARAQESRAQESRAQESGVQADAPQRCAVAYVVDGDTFNCRDGTSVRLILVDAPEGGRFGDASRRALSTLLSVDSTVRLETDREVRDRQGRVRAYVSLADGRMVNEVMIRKGFAFFKPSPPNQRYAARLRDAEEAARRDGIGVWSY